MQLLTLGRPSIYWDPKEDITTFELALAVNALIAAPWAAALLHIIEQQPENVQRHFYVDATAA